jgi:hypothetical protein
MGLLAYDIYAFFLEGSCELILSFLVMAECKFVDEMGKVVIGLTLVAIPIAVDTFFEIPDGLFGLCLFQTFVTDEQVGAAGLVIVLFHH